MIIGHAAHRFFQNFCRYNTFYFFAQTLFRPRMDRQSAGVMFVSTFILFITHHEIGLNEFIDTTIEDLLGVSDF